MRATVLPSPGDIRLDTLPDPVLEADTDAIVRVEASCVCGSDLWPYRGIGRPQTEPRQIGHEHVGVVEHVGSAVADVSVGDFVIAPFLYSDNTCVHCRNGVQSSCVNGGGYTGCQADLVRIPQADGTLMTVPGGASQELLPHMLALSDVIPTGHHAAVSAGVTAGSTVAVVGDGAVGLSAVLAAKRLGAKAGGTSGKPGTPGAAGKADGGFKAEKGGSGKFKIKSTGPSSESQDTENVAVSSETGTLTTPLLLILAAFVVAGATLTSFVSRNPMG